MQKLQIELKNVPTDTSLVCSSTNSGLNKEEILSTLSDQNKVLTCNNSEENLRVWRNLEQNLRVSVAKTSIFLEIQTIKERSSALTPNLKVEQNQLTLIL